MTNVTDAQHAAGRATLQPRMRHLLEALNGGSARKPTRRHKKNRARARDKQVRAARKRNRSTR